MTEHIQSAPQNGWFPSLKVWLVTSLLFAPVSGMATTHCITFDKARVGVLGTVGRVKTLKHFKVKLLSYWLTHSISTSGGEARITNTQYARASSPEMNLNNINIGFKPKKPITELEFKFGYQGGSTNLIINGQRFVAGSPCKFPHRLGNTDVTVTCSGDPYYVYGTVKVVGDIKMIATGGQEYFIDNICHR